jgi:regulator of protease activity HflC (stomatin/prohibitin superfamily)
MSGLRATAVTAERDVVAISGWPMLFFNVLLLVGAVIYLIATGVQAGPGSDASLLPRILAGVAVELIAVFLLFGYFTLQPNEARVLILFGNYKGTVRSGGFRWANPLYARSRGQGPAKPAPATGTTPAQRFRMGGNLSGGGHESLSTKLSLRARNFNSETLKVNDKRGNPVEIAAVVVWRISDTAQAAFDVEDYGSYVQVQSESAIRSIASRYAYDHGEQQELTLRGGADEVAHALKEELEVRLAKAGVLVEEARLTHLAYAPEIAPVMLRRQQAEAIVAARQIIVQNAVSMVHMALRELDAKQMVSLDEERRAAMVSNLLVVLCGSSDPSPVINTGTLYS